MIETIKNELILDDNSVAIVNKLCYHSARLYNTCIYEQRQAFTKRNVFLSFKELWQIVKENENFHLLHTDASNQILHKAYEAFESFKSLLKKKKNGEYDAKVRLPGYLDKEGIWSFFLAGRACRYKNGKLHIGLSKNFREKYEIKERDLIIPFIKDWDYKKINQCQIKPSFKGLRYQLIINYETKEEEVTTKELGLDKNIHLSMDPGVTNLYSVVDVYNAVSFIIDGKPIKSSNQFYNKMTSERKSVYDKLKQTRNTSRMMKLNKKRDNIINNYFNHTVKLITDYCLLNGIGTIVVGQMKGIKQEIELGKVNNQNFVQIPFEKLNQKLKSKCEKLGIDLIFQEESYTSKANCLMLDEMKKDFAFTGKRIKRGLYESKCGTKINADINGAINILRKYFKSSSKADLTADEVRAASTCQIVRINPLRDYPSTSSPSNLFVGR